MAESRLPSDDVPPDALGQPLKFDYCGLTAPNRFFKAAMSERLCTWDPKTTSTSPKGQDLIKTRGIPTNALIQLYVTWARGGIGVIATGNVMVDATHLEAAGNPIVTKDCGARSGDERFEAFRRLATAVKAEWTGPEGSRNGRGLIIAQLNHAGRQVQKTIEPNPISASDVTLKLLKLYGKPRPATKKELDEIVEGFAHAAEYLEKAGYDGVQLHSAHGYLLAQFLSPTTNRRTDEYGGSLENRTRLIVRIARAIRKRCSRRFLLAIKINSVEFQDQGLTPEEARQLCAVLEAETFDFVELSGGTYEQMGFHHRDDGSKGESTRRREAYFIQFAELLTPSLNKTKTYITGGLRSVGAMVKALDVVDGVGLARPLCQEPDLAKGLLEGRIRSALQLQIREADFGLASSVAGAQMWQIGKGQKPIDLSKKENEQMFQRVRAKSGSFGYPDLTR